jgi:hypothetical protein
VDSPLVIVASFGLAAAVALSAHSWQRTAARVGAILALSVMPAAIYNTGAFVRYVVEVSPEGRTEGWVNQGGFLVWLVVIGTLPASSYRTSLECFGNAACWQRLVQCSLPAGGAPPATSAEARDGRLEELHRRQCLDGSTVFRP